MRPIERSRRWLIKFILLAGLMTIPSSAAPFVGPSLKEVIRILSARDAKQKMPLTLGRYEPQAVIDFSKGKWRLSRLERKATTPRAKPDSGGNFVPEITWSELTPSPPLIQEADKQEFIRALKNQRVIGDLY